MSLPVYVVDWLWEEADQGQLQPGVSLDFTGSEAHHAVSARRTHVGERIALVDGYGLRVTLDVTQIDKDRVVGTALSVSHDPLHSPTITLVQALAKGGRDEQAIETASEYGVDVVMPWQADRSVVRWHGSAKVARGLDKWQATVRAAAKQSRRSWIARVDPLVDSVSLTAWIGRAVAAGTQVLLCHEEASVKLTQIVQENAGSWGSHGESSRSPDGGGTHCSTATTGSHERDTLPDFTDIALIVGPEGGVSPEEITAFEAAGAHTVLLGEHVMRASSAGPWAIAVIRALHP
ncbi:MAG: 16S rRNA (uracil(1498)-N(3))-methyltransferase [Actinomycetaceae bacterium]|nr:16S rRNA (uracil(1498)-N(3))-methyltransferase [Arcanobacterium sp.]MDD7686352.1 16S rRNA (uracil(1498)-N(3))-methyltransferase [Actinomycetaceae bacterium]MDY5274211.1 16S rRNA (uracil(1498)-N(3))-methyltransferase [Arcanobacterium sp.]